MSVATCRNSRKRFAGSCPNGRGGLLGSMRTSCFDISFQGVSLMFREYLYRVYRSLITGSRKPRSRRVPRTSRPAVARLAVEGLEDRALPATLMLTNGALVYTPSTVVDQYLTISHDTGSHRYTFW